MLLFADGFGQYGIKANMLLAGYTVASLDLVSGRARNGVWCLQQNSNNFQFARVPIGANKNPVGVGFAMNVETMTYGLIFLSLTDDANLPQVTFILIPDGSIQVRRGDAFGTVLGTSPPESVIFGNWQYVEIRTVIADSGLVEIRVNEQRVLILDGFDTKNTAYNGAASVTLGSDNSFGTPHPSCLYDDFIIWDDTAGLVDDFQGEVNCRTLLPTADTSTAQWTPRPSAPGFSKVDNVPFVLTDYIEASAANLTSEFTVPLIPTSDYAIQSVIVSALIEQTNNVADTVSIGVNSSGAIATGAAFTPGQTPLYSKAVFELDPKDGGKPWTARAINLLRLHIKRN